MVFVGFVVHTFLGVFDVCDGRIFDRETIPLVAFVNKTSVHVSLNHGRDCSNDRH